MTLGEVAERFKALVSKTSMGAISSWVRIPPSPLSVGGCVSGLHDLAERSQFPVRAPERC